MNTPLTSLIFAKSPLNSKAIFKTIKKSKKISFLPVIKTLTYIKPLGLLSEKKRHGAIKITTDIMYYININSIIPSFIT